MARWGEAMRGYVKFLAGQRSQDVEVASTLTVLELPNLFALLDLVQRGLQRRQLTWPLRSTACCKRLGKPRLLERVGQVRDRAAAALGDTWNHAQFDAERTAH